MIRGYSHLIGKKFSHLLVQKEIRKEGRTRLQCICDCGKTKSILGYHIKRKQIQSCGCRSAKSFGKNNPTYTGFEDISGSYWGKIKDGAKSRRLPFRISIEYAWKVFLKQKRRCAISGESLRFNSGFRIRDGNASLDRIDSSKGYVKGNIQWVHKSVNKLKGNFSDKEIIRWSRIISSYNSKHQQRI